MRGLTVILYRQFWKNALLGSLGWFGGNEWVKVLACSRAFSPFFESSDKLLKFDKNTPN